MEDASRAPVSRLSVAPGDDFYDTLLDTLQSTGAANADGSGGAEGGGGGEPAGAPLMSEPEAVMTLSAIAPNATVCRGDGSFSSRGVCFDIPISFVFVLNSFESIFRATCWLKSGLAWRSRTQVNGSFRRRGRGVCARGRTPSRPLSSTCLNSGDLRCRRMTTTMAAGRRIARGTLTTTTVTVGGRSHAGLLIHSNIYSSSTRRGNNLYPRPLCFV